MVFQPAHDLVVLLIFRAGIEEFLIFLVLVDDVEQALVGAVRTEEDLALAVQDELLEIERHSLGDTEILGILGYGKFQLFTDPEKMVNCMTAGENDCTEKRNFDFLLPELFGRDAFQSDEWMEIQLHPEFPFQIEIRGFFRLRSGLRD